MSGFRAAYHPPSIFPERTKAGKKTKKEKKKKNKHAVRECGSRRHWLYNFIYNFVLPRTNTIIHTRACASRRHLTARRGDERIERGGGKKEDWKRRNPPTTKNDDEKLHTRTTAGRSQKKKQNSLSISLHRQLITHDCSEPACNSSISAVARVVYNYFDHIIGLFLPPDGLRVVREGHLRLRVHAHRVQPAIVILLLRLSKRAMIIRRLFMKLRPLLLLDWHVGRVSHG